LRPCAEALIHRVRVQRSVLTQPLVQAGDGVAADEGLVIRQHAAFFGIQDEDEPQEHREQRMVDLIRALAERSPQQLAPARLVGRLEATQQLVEGVEHLLGESLADFVLVLAAVLEQGGEALSSRQSDQAALAQQ